MIVQAGQAFSFDYTAYDQSTSLFIRAAVWDVTGSPTHITDVVMNHVSSGSYVGSFTPTLNHNYQIIKVVYTDGTYTTADPLRSPGVDSVEALNTGSGTIVTVLQPVQAQLAFQINKSVSLSLQTTTLKLTAIMTIDPQLIP